MPPPAPVPPAYPPPPPPAIPQGPSAADQAFAAIGAQGRALLSGLDPSGTRPTLIVAAVLAVIVFGSLLLNGALPARSLGGQPPVQPGQTAPPVSQPGQPIEVAGGIRVYPPAGWIAAPPPATGGQWTNTIQLQKGAAIVDLYVRPGFQGDLGALASAFLNEVLAPSSSQLAVSQGVTVPVGGATGVRVTYTGNFNGQALEGIVIAVILNGRPIVFDAWAPQGQLAPYSADIDRIAQTVEVR
jgi:hypothetical protein